MTLFDTWESYFYPETLHSNTPVLVNRLDIRDAHGLKNTEYALTDDRLRELREIPGLINRTFDGLHLRAIHQYLFQDVYEWAGQYRTVEIRKGGHNFASLAEIERYVQYATSIIRSSDWQTLTATSSVKRQPGFMHT